MYVNERWSITTVQLSKSDAETDAWNSSTKISFFFTFLRLLLYLMVKTVVELLATPPPVCQPGQICFGNTIVDMSASNFDFPAKIYLIKTSTKTILVDTGNFNRLLTGCQWLNKRKIAT